MKNWLYASAAALALSIATVGAQAAPVDLSSWIAEGDGRWNLEAGNNAVKQTINGLPTVFHNAAASSQGQALSGTIQVQEFGGDNDFVGFVLGYHAGDLTNASADYILIDWKQGNQTEFGCVGGAGLAVSRVTGALGNNSGAWCHEPMDNVTELQRATTLGNTGWADNAEYTFDLIFTASAIQVKVNGLTELNIAGSFADGGFGFYNYSQPQVRYAGIEEDVAPSIPVPAGLLLMGPVLGLAGMVARKRSA